MSVPNPTRAALEECVRAMEAIRADYTQTRSFLMDECEGNPKDLSDERGGEVEACTKFIIMLDATIATVRKLLDGEK